MINYFLPKLLVTYGMLTSMCPPYFTFPVQFYAELLAVKIDVKFSNTMLRSRAMTGGFFGPQSVEILVFASPTSYMVTSSGFPLLIWGIFYIFLRNDW